MNIIFNQKYIQDKKINIFQKKLVIPEGVTILAPYILSNVEILEELVLPESLRIIQKTAIANCSNLKSVNLPKNLERIDDFAFIRDYKLTGSLIIPDKVTFIGDGAFRECGFNETLILGKSFKTLTNNSFYKNKFKKIIFKGNIKIADIIRLSFYKDVKEILFYNFYDMEHKISFLNKSNVLGINIVSDIEPFVKKIEPLEMITKDGILLKNFILNAFKNKKLKIIDIDKEIFKGSYIFADIDMDKLNTIIEDFLALNEESEDIKTVKKLIDILDETLEEIKKDIY